MRFALGAVGTVAGVMGGGYLGPVLYNDRGCRCGEEARAHEFVGIFVGTVVVSALLAAAPTLGSECSFGQRVRRGMVGSAAAGAFGFAAAALSGSEIPFVLGTGIGAAIGPTLCRK